MTEEEKPKLRFIELSKEGRGANCSVMRERHEIIYGIHAEGYLLKKDKQLIETEESKGEWVSMTDKTCNVFSEERSKWITVPISNLAHKVDGNLDRFTDYRITFDLSKGIVISRLDVFPYEEKIVKQPSYMWVREYTEQLLPESMKTGNKWKHSHAHNLWFRETTSKDLDKFLETLLLEDFKTKLIDSRPEEHTLWQDPVQFSKSISELLKDISIYNRMKYNPHNNLNLEKLFW